MSLNQGAHAAPVCCQCGSTNAPYGIGPPGPRPKRRSLLPQMRSYCWGCFSTTASGQEYIMDRITAAAAAATDV